METLLSAPVVEAAPVVAAPVVPAVVAAVVPEPVVEGAKPAVIDPAAAKTEPKIEEAKTGAPEKYADFTLPEGAVPDTATMDQFKALAKAKGLSQEAAQELVSFNSNIATKNSEASAAAYTKTVEGWKSETIAFLGVDHAKELAFASKALDKVGTPKLRALLDETGLGNHPEVVSMLIKAGKLVSEGNLVEGKNGDQSKKTAAEIIYPTKK